MKSFFILFKKNRNLRFLLFSVPLFGIALALLSNFGIISSESRNMLSVGIKGVHHMGEKFAVSEFYVNGYWGGNVGNEGGGGSTVCCIMLPKKWRPGLVGDLRWSVSDWSKENKEQTAVGNYSSVDWTLFRAIVPVEKYEGTPNELYVHFFADGKVRLVSSRVGSGNKKHPIRDDDFDAASIATQGNIANSLFTDLEINNFLDKASKEKKGNWK